MTNILAYKKRLSGPLSDRIDITISFCHIPHRELLNNKSSTKEQHIQVLASIKSARIIQEKRYNSSKKSNNSLTNQEIREFAPLKPLAEQFLDNAAEMLNLSARSYFKVIQVARTIADIARENGIQITNLAEALHYHQAT